MFSDIFHIGPSNLTHIPRNMGNMDFSIFLGARS